LHILYSNIQNALPSLSKEIIHVLYLHVMQNDTYNMVWKQVND